MLAGVMGATGGGAAALETVATYGDLPASPSPNQAVFVTDVSSVYQWDGAAWNLLTTITVATSGDLPSSGVSSGDKALVGGNQVWTKNVGIGWTQTAPAPAGVATDPASDLDLATDYTGEVEFSSTALAAASLSLSGGDAASLALDVDQVVTSGGNPQTVTLTRQDFTAIADASLDWQATDGSTGSVAITADEVASLAALLTLQSFNHVWGFATSTEDTGVTGGKTLTFSGTSREASALQAALGQINLDGATDHAQIGTTDFSRTQDRTFVLYWTTTTYTNTRCHANFGTFNAASVFGYFAINGSGALVWQKQDLATALQALATASSAGSNRQLVVIRYVHGGTSKLDYRHAGGSRVSVSGSVAAGSTGNESPILGGNGTLYNGVDAKVACAGIKNGSLTDAQVNALFTMVGMG